MNESSWDECIESCTSLKISPDKAKSRSLIETAQGRIAYVKNNELNEATASYIFEGYYSSVLELMHALLCLKGYKVENHLCIGFYIRDILKKEQMYRLFDDCRIKRNSLLYHGKMQDFSTAKACIEKCIKLVHEIELMIKEELK